METTTPQNFKIDIVARASRYVVRCPACRANFDALAAGWCRCVAKQFSPVCPACAVCLCKASDSARLEFWMDAPSSLQTSRTEERRRRSRESSAVAADTVDVLIVDDDEEIRLIAAYTVQQLGYSVTLASSGQEALAAVCDNPPR